MAREKLLLGLIIGSFMIPNGTKPVPEIGARNQKKELFIKTRNQVTCGEAFP